ncbi:Hypothetical predicted protein, partial [Scomber scombrus]
MEFEDQLRAVRPKCQTRPPTSLDDCEVNNISNRQRHRNAYSPRTAYIDHRWRDAVLHEADQCYTELQKYSPETHLAHPREQEVMRRDIVGLQAEMRRLTNMVVSLQQATPLPVIHCDSQSVYNGTEDQEEPSDQPMIERLDQLMAELQLIKNQAMTASHRKQSSVRVDSRPAQYPPPWRL